MEGSCSKVASNHSSFPADFSDTECCLISEGSFEATDISNYFTAFFPSKKVLVVNVVHLKMLLDLKKTSLKSR